MGNRAAERINAEMQKKPDNFYIEVIGTYIIDRCNSEADVEAAVYTSGEGALKKCLEKIKSEAKKKAFGSCAVMSDNEIFDIVDRFFCISKNVTARTAIKNHIDKDNEVESPTVTAYALDMNFEDLF